MKTIIAPTDFSTASTNACLYAAMLANALSAELVIIHVTELPVSVSEYALIADNDNDRDITSLLQQLKHKLLMATNYHVLINTRLVTGSVEHEITELCKIKKPVALVISSHTSSAIERFLLGSTTIYMNRHLEYPVITVPANCTYSAVKKIGFATDLKNVYEVPVEDLENILKIFKASLDVYYVSPTHNISDKNSIQQLFLDHRLKPFNPNFFEILNNDVVEGVEALAISNHADMILILPRHNGLFHKSQTKNFIQRSTFPVLALHEYNQQNAN